MGKNPGKKFEQDFQNSLKKHDDVYIHRIRDVRFYRGSTSIGDFLVYKYPKLYPLELKSIKGISINLTPQYNDDGEVHRYGYINKTQLDMMLDVKMKHVVPAFILNFRGENVTYFLSPEKVVKFLKLMENGGRKSINIPYCEKNGIKLHQELKRTRYTYFPAFLDKIKS